MYLYHHIAKKIKFFLKYHKGLPRETQQVGLESQTCWQGDIHVTHDKKWNVCCGDWTFAQNPNFGLKAGPLRERSLSDKGKECCLIEARGFFGNRNNSDYRSRPLVEKQVYRDLYFSFGSTFQEQLISLTTRDTRSSRGHMPWYTNTYWSPTMHRT